MSKYLLSILFIFPLTIFGYVGGTGWKVEQGVDKMIFLFDKDGTFVILNLGPVNTGNVFGDEDDTWRRSGDKIVYSFNDGYQICSTTLNSNKKIFVGTCINELGQVDEVIGQLIE